MEEQLLLMNEMDRRFKIGDEIEGEILSANSRQKMKEPSVMALGRRRENARD